MKCHYMVLFTFQDVNNNRAARVQFTIPTPPNPNRYVTSYAAAALDGRFPRSRIAYAVESQHGTLVPLNDGKQVVITEDVVLEGRGETDFRNACRKRCRALATLLKSDLKDRYEWTGLQEDVEVED